MREHKRMKESETPMGGMFMPGSVLGLDMESAERYVNVMPEDLKVEFIAWLARRDRENEYRGHRRGFQLGYEHGWHSGLQDPQNY